MVVSSNDDFIQQQYQFSNGENLVVVILLLQKVKLSVAHIFCVTAYIKNEFFIAELLQLHKPQSWMQNISIFILTGAVIHGNGQPHSTPAFIQSTKVL